MRRGLPGGLGPGHGGRDDASFNLFWQKALSLLDDRERHIDTSSCVLPTDAAVFFQSTGWELPDAATHRHALNDIKGLLDDLDNTTWDNYARLANYAEYVRRDLRKQFQVEMATIAWAKMYELLVRYNLMPVHDPSAAQTPPAPSVPPAKTVHGASQAAHAPSATPVPPTKPPTKPPTPAVVTVHLCEAPGGFVAACNHFLRTQRPGWHWEWLAVSLNPYYGGNDQFAMVDDDALLQATLQHWCFGADDSGDVRRPENIRAIWVEARRRCDAAGVSGAALVTADGAVDSSMLPAVQELMNAPLIYCEVVAALGLLAPGGSLVVKVFTLLEHPSVCVMHLLGCLFQDVTVCKPCTSKACNSELYVVARGFRGVAPAVLELLLSMCDEDTFARGALLPLNMLPPPFLRSTLGAAAHFAACTGEAIRDALDKSGLPPNGPTATALRRVKERFAAEWFCRTQLLRLDRRYFLAPQEAFDGSNNSTSNVLGRRRELLGTLQERQEQYRRRRNDLGLDGEGLLAAAAMLQGQLGSSYESADCISLGSSPSGGPGLGSYERSPGRGLGSVSALVGRVSSSMSALRLGLGLSSFLRSEVTSGDGAGDGDGEVAVGALGGGEGGGRRGPEAPMEVSGTIGKLMAKMGYKEGAGLGRQLQGIAAAIPAVGNVGRAGLGLGSGTGTERTAGLGVGAVRFAATVGLGAGLGSGGGLGLGAVAQDLEWTPNGVYGGGLGDGVCEDEPSGCSRAGLGCKPLEAGTEVNDMRPSAAAVITAVPQASWAPAPDVRMLRNEHPLTAAEVAAWTYDTAGATGEQGAADVAAAAAAGPAASGGLGRQVPPAKLIKSKMIVDDNILVALRRARTGYNEAAAAAAKAPAAAAAPDPGPHALGFAATGAAHVANCSSSSISDSATLLAACNGPTSTRSGKLCKHIGPICVAPRRRGAGASGRSYWKLASLDCALRVCRAAAAAATATGMGTVEVPAGRRGPHALDLSLYSAGATDYLLGAAVMTQLGSTTGQTRDWNPGRHVLRRCVSDRSQERTSGGDGGSHDIQGRRGSDEDVDLDIGRANSTDGSVASSSVASEARERVPGSPYHAHHHSRCSTVSRSSSNDMAAGDSAAPACNSPEYSPAPGWSVALLDSPAARAYARRLGEQVQTAAPAQHHHQQPQVQSEHCTRAPMLDRLRLLPLAGIDLQGSNPISSDDLLDLLTPETSRAVAAACVNHVTVNAAVIAAGPDTVSPIVSPRSSSSGGANSGGGIVGGGSGCGSTGGGEKKCCLVVGDLTSLQHSRCGWPASSCGPLEGEYDTLYRRRLLWEAATALSVLAPGGAVVLRLGDCLTMFTASVLYILHRSFSKLAVVKPFASCACSPERFVVGLGRLEDGGVAAAQLLAGLQAVRQVETSVPRRLRLRAAATAASGPAAAAAVQSGRELERDGDMKLTDVAKEPPRVEAGSQLLEVPQKSTLRDFGALEACSEGSEGGLAQGEDEEAAGRSAAGRLPGDVRVQEGGGGSSDVGHAGCGLAPTRPRVDSSDSAAGAAKGAKAEAGNKAGISDKGGASENGMASLEPYLLTNTGTSPVRKPRSVQSTRSEDEEEANISDVDAVVAASSSPHPVRPAAGSRPHGVHNAPSRTELNVSAPPFTPTSIVIRRHSSFDHQAPSTPSPKDSVPTTPSPPSPYRPAAATAAATTATSSTSVASWPNADQPSHPMAITGVAPVGACVGGSFYVYLAGHTQELAVRQVRACEAALAAASTAQKREGAVRGGIGYIVAAAAADDPHELVVRQALEILGRGMAGASPGDAVAKQRSSESDPDADLIRKYGSTFTRGGGTTAIGSAPFPHHSWMDAAEDSSTTAITTAVPTTTSPPISTTHGEQVDTAGRGIPPATAVAAAGAPHSLRSCRGSGIQRVAVAAGPPANSVEGGGPSWGGGPPRRSCNAGTRGAANGDVGSTSWSGQGPVLLMASSPCSGRHGAEASQRPSGYKDSSWHPPPSYGGSQTSASYIASGVNTPSGASTPYGTSPQHGKSLPCTSSLSLARDEGTGAAAAFIRASPVIQGPGLLAAGAGGGWRKDPCTNGSWGASPLPRPGPQQSQYGRLYCNAERGVVGCGRAKATWGMGGRSNTGSWRRADDEVPAANWVTGPDLATGGGCGCRGATWGAGGNGQGRRDGPRTPDQLGRVRSGVGAGGCAVGQGRRPMRGGQLGSAEEGQGQEGPASSEVLVVVEEAGWERVACTGHRRRAQQLC